MSKWNTVYPVEATVKILVRTYVELPSDHRLTLAEMQEVARKQIVEEANRNIEFIIPEDYEVEECDIEEPMFDDEGAWNEEDLSD